MERADFEALIERMERVAIERPMAYRRRVFGLAALGYGYLFFVVLVLLVLSAVSRNLEPCLPQGPWLEVSTHRGCVALRGVTVSVVKQDPPRGEKVTAADAPKLLKMIERAAATSSDALDSYRSDHAGVQCGGQPSAANGALRLAPEFLGAWIALDEGTDG